jgi:uncharacterized membrane protein YwaF
MLITHLVLWVLTSIYIFVDYKIRYPKEEWWVTIVAVGFISFYCFFWELIGARMLFFPKKKFLS